eukprot:2108073-Pyramimonas_sp.AAC.1
MRYGLRISGSRFNDGRQLNSHSAAATQQSHSAATQQQQQRSSNAAATQQQQQVRDSISFTCPAPPTRRTIKHGGA